MKLKLNYTIFLLAGALLIGACTNYHTKKGNLYYNNLAYSDAANHYEKAFRKSNNGDVGMKLADSYYKMSKLDSAESIYREAMDGGNNSPSLLFNYGKVLMANGKHQQASQYFKKYLQIYSTDPVALMLYASCNSVQQRYRDTTLYTLKPIWEDKFINTFSVIEYQNGAVFAADKEVFSGKKTAAWTGNSYLDLYFMKRDAAGNWLTPELLQGDINGRLHEGPATFSHDGNTVYFTRSNYFKKKMKLNDERENNLKIFQATLVNNKWVNLVDFPYNSDDYSCGHPSLSQDGKTMYFVSDMPGGFGGTDIYKTTLIEDAWSKPENLGSVINTPGNEMFPYIHEDDALYFSSDAHNSMGGLDVFISYHNGDLWVQPENLNYPLNSVKDDFGFSLSDDHSKGFVSSSRSKTDKIYTFDKSQPTFNLYGTAFEKGTKKPVEGVTVEISDSKTGAVINMVSDVNGKFKVKLSPETDYHLYCTKFGCFSRTDEISTIGLKYSEDFYADFEVEPIVINKPIVLENIYYDYDKWDIRPDAAIELNKLVRILKDNPTIEIEMGSHTDSRGNDQYNLILSDKRARAAVSYISSQGIDISRLTFRGYGEKVHVNNCGNDVPCSEEEHQKNRRTEFKVTKIRK